MSWAQPEAAHYEVVAEKPIDSLNTAAEPAAKVKGNVKKKFKKKGGQQQQAGDKEPFVPWWKARKDKQKPGKPAKGKGRGKGKKGKA